MYVCIHACIYVCGTVCGVACGVVHGCACVGVCHAYSIRTGHLQRRRNSLPCRLDESPLHPSLCRCKGRMVIDSVCVNNRSYSLCLPKYLQRYTCTHIGHTRKDAHTHNTHSSFAYIPWEKRCHHKFHFCRLQFRKQKAFSQMVCQSL